MSPTKTISAQQRHCPGDNCDIAEHICRARQIRSYPPCKECDWGEGQRKSKTLTRTEQDQLSSVLDQVVKAYDIDIDDEVCRMDVLYGVKTLYPELACRIRGAEG